MRCVVARFVSPRNGCVVGRFVSLRNGCAVGRSVSPSINLEQIESQ